jgi:single-stranded-DNA-specific exonuclease
VIHSDGELPPAELSLETARALRGAGPWGAGFPEPVFDGEFTVADARIVGGKHLKLQLRAGAAAHAGAPLDAIAFGHGTELEIDRLRPGARIDLAYRLEVNEYNGAEQMQLNCQHLQVR